MSRIASVKETGEELSEAEWKRFEDAVESEVERRPKAEPYERGAQAAEPSRAEQSGTSSRGH
ncbi:hypothetical protein [Beijerinckia sp. L45]|uniref:hypothetical protein n=1 Tax=Beijerinckia sp. L45 TaxID=1641855 RepID=UPI00131B8F72|nr:hypothetical protein [Beijerinckia sp. L45]